MPVDSQIWGWTASVRVDLRRYVRGFRVCALGSYGEGGVLPSVMPRAAGIAPKLGDPHGQVVNDTGPPTERAGNIGIPSALVLYSDSGSNGDLSPHLVRRRVTAPYVLLRQPGAASCSGAVRCVRRAP